MILTTTLSDGVFALSANDRRTELFENLWTLPSGVSYNAYVVVDQKCALLDTINSCSGGDIISVVENILDGRNLDYLVLHHLEPDHSTEIDSVIRRYPTVKIVGNKRTFDILRNYFAVKEENLLCVEEGSELSLGSRTLRFLITPWLHWPETMMSFEVSESILFSGDVFGTFGALEGALFDEQTDTDKYGEEMLRYYTNVIGKYNGMVVKSLPKIEATNAKMLCPLHGIIWRTNPGKAIEFYKRWSKLEPVNDAVIVYGSMYGNTAASADYMARRMADGGMRSIKVFDVSKTPISYIITEIWRARCVVLGSCAYNGMVLPTMQSLMDTIAHIPALQCKPLAIFGSSSWNGAGVKTLRCAAENHKWNVIAEPAEIMGFAEAAKMSPFDVLADKIVESAKSC